MRSGAPDADGRHRPDPAAAPLPPLFVVKVDAQTNAYAFKIPPSPSSPPRPRRTRPAGSSCSPSTSYRTRFGFDELDHRLPAPALDELERRRVAAPRREPRRAACVPVRRGHAVAGSGSGRRGVTEPRWDRDSADVARIVLQRPFRVAIQADLLLQPPEVPA